MVKSAPVNISVSGNVVPASISIAASATSILTGASITFTGQYLDSAGSGIGGATLYVFVNGTSVMSVVTTAGGGYSATLTFPNAGAYNVNVSDNTGNV